ncbi:myb-related transcription factor, partner of profilin [Pogona vitticeps]
MSGESEEITRLRKPRFSYEENQILIQEVRANYAKLYGTQSRRVTVAERRRVWEGIAAKINGITSWKRTGQEVQKRWNDFKRRTKEKLARVPHSTQGAGTAGEETFLAEEETIFAILGPGVVTGTGGGGGGGAEPSSACRNTPPPGFGATHGVRLAAEHGAEIPAGGHPSSCSPKTSAHRVSCYPLDGGLLRPKERDSPAPPSAQPASLQIVQLAPSPASLSCGPHAEPSPMEPPGATPCPSTSPLPRRRRTCLDPAGEPPLDFLQAQRETAEAIRELNYTLRQGLERLTDIVAALLPLLPVQTNNVSPPQEGIPAPAPPPSSETLLPRDAFTTKVEPSLEPEEYEARSPGDEGQPVVAETGTSPTRVPPPQKGRKGIPTRKRRGRWKNV